tara:strand:+ start:673 stop:1602 length:930 start_codon:yes stop_codon:yes gene_type:complete
MNSYIKIARFDHWFKNIFVLPGFLFSYALIDGIDLQLDIFFRITMGLVGIGFIASANYTINEYLDAEFDRFHPIKKERAGAKGQLRINLVIIQYLLLITLGLGISYFFINLAFTYINVLFLVMGLLYNVKPFRTKDKPFIDVLSESVNNPIRFLLGWVIISPYVFPPTSILFSYWFGGAFLMAIKRLSEYRSINNPELAGKYRSSFRFYNENNLLLSSFFYALNSVFFLGIFLIKYRIEFLLSFPIVSALFTIYLHLGLMEDSITQTPEKLYKSKSFLIFCLLSLVIIFVLYFVDINFLNVLINPINYK